jgi:hypothetical protein
MHPDRARNRRRRRGSRHDPAIAGLSAPLACLTKGREALLAFFDFPAEH